MSTYYYADSRNQTVGPVTLADLRELARRGELAAATPVIAHGSNTWTTLGAAVNETPSAEIAEAVVHHTKRIQGQISASFSEVSWGAAFFGLLLVVIQFLIEPCLIIRKSLVELTDWGKASRLPINAAEYPLPNFMIVVLRGTVILLITIISLVLIIYFLCTGQMNPLDSSTMIAPDFKERIDPAIWRLVITYFEIIFIAFGFDCMLIFLNLGQNVKKLTDLAGKP